MYYVHTKWGTGHHHGHWIANINKFNDSHLVLDLAESTAGQIIKGISKPTIKAASDGLLHKGSRKKLTSYLVSSQELTVLILCVHTCCILAKDKRLASTQQTELTQ